MLRASALAAASLATAAAHGSMVMPLGRNSIDAELPAWSGGKHPYTGEIQPYSCACTNGTDECSSGQSCFWFSQGCTIGCPGTLPRRRAAHPAADRHRRAPRATLQTDRRCAPQSATTMARASLGLTTAPPSPRPSPASCPSTARPTNGQRRAPLRTSFDSTPGGLPGAPLSWTRAASRGAPRPPASTQRSTPQPSTRSRATARPTCSSRDRPAPCGNGELLQRFGGSSLPTTAGAISTG